jgi:hypothetical protein
MRRLARRIHGVQGNHKRAMAGYAPAASSAGSFLSPDQPPPPQPEGVDASPDSVSVMPEAQVLVYPEPGGGYSTLAYRGLVPLFTADGAVVPASSPGGWGQLRMAGRP